MFGPILKRLQQLENWFWILEGKTAGGGGGAAPPFSRAKWIDGGSAAVGPTDGSVGHPFKTIGAWLATLPVPVDITDAGVTQATWMVPAVYTESTAFPPARTTELRALSGFGDAQVGNITWPNTAIPGGRPQAQIATLSLYNFTLFGNVVVTSDGTCTSPLHLSVSSDSQDTGDNSVVTGGIDGTGATQLVGVFLQNRRVNGAVNVPSALLTVDGGTLVGAVTAHNGVFTGVTFKGALSFTSVVNSDIPTFDGCTFDLVPHPLSSVAFVLFDADSWLAFRRALWTRTATTVAVVAGGYDGAPVEGAPLTDADLQVSLTGATATAGFTQGGNHYTLPAGTLTADHTLTLGVDNAPASPGDTLLVTRLDTSAHAYNIHDDIGNPLITLPGGAPSSALFQRNAGARFVLVSFGTLAAGASGPPKSYQATLAADTTISNVTSNLLTVAVPALAGRTALTLEACVAGEVDAGGHTGRFRIKIDAGPMQTGFCCAGNGTAPANGSASITIPASAAAHTVILETDTDAGVFYIFPSGAATPPGLRSPAYPMQATLTVTEASL